MSKPIEKIKELQVEKDKVINKIENRKGVKKVKGVVKDFKKFANKGNIIDMATGVIIGTAFTKIVNSLVSEIVTPILSKLTGKVDLKNLFIPLSSGNFSSITEANEAGVITINYGIFLSNIIDFLIISFTIFIFLRYTFNKRAKTVETEAKSNKKCPYCLSDIPLEAIKCAHCTSDLAAGNTPEEEAAK